MFKSNSVRWVVVILAISVCGSVLLADNKPWEGKPFQEWDAKDVQRIMTESPWVQTTTIERSWLSVAEKDVPPEQPIAGGVRTMPNNPAAANRESEESERQLKAYVYWDSSHVMRAASARNAVLHGMMKDSDVEQYASAPQAEYQLVLYMADMTPFLRNDEKFFEDKAYIETKRGKLKVLPSHVKYDRDDNGRLKDVIFFFPKRTTSGEPTIAASETEVTFNCKLDRSRVNVNFDVRKMVGTSGLDL
ncbi:MAG TPA: hypothetical protein VKS44_05080 [Candidatus Acidoferrales bacterium]|nr:hypothetical protein [Candidatus Acidoferrales bacterium]